MKNLIILLTATILLSGCQLFQTTQEIANTVTAATGVKIKIDNGIENTFNHGLKLSNEEKIISSKALKAIKDSKGRLEKYSTSGKEVIKAISKIEAEVEILTVNYKILAKISNEHWEEYTQEGKLH